MEEAGDPELGRGTGLGPQLGKGVCRLGEPPRPAASSSAARAETEYRRGRPGGGMNDTPLAPDIAAAASATATSPSLRLLPLRPGGEGEGEGLENLTDSGVAVGNRERQHLPPPSSSAPPPLSLSAPLV